MCEFVDHDGGEQQEGVQEGGCVGGPADAGYEARELWSECGDEEGGNEEPADSHVDGGSDHGADEDGTGGALVRCRGGTGRGGSAGVRGAGHGHDSTSMAGVA